MSAFAFIHRPLNLMPKLTKKEPVEDQNERLYSRADLATKLGVCVHTIARLERAGKISSIRFSRRLLRYRGVDVNRLIEEAA